MLTRFFWKIYYSFFLLFKRILITIHLANLFDYSSNKIKVKDNSGKEHEADKVIITVPLKILQEGMIHFTPQLPQYKSKAIHSLEVMRGFNVFSNVKKSFMVLIHCLRILSKVVDNGYIMMRLMGKILMIIFLVFCV